ncbi:MAG: beta-glucosidase [Barnesiella sp.]|nr:beta-glucosidase [Barnesiella sp.]
MRKGLIMCVMACVAPVAGSVSVAAAEPVPVYRNAAVPVEERIDDLLSRMTTREKVLQLNQFYIGTNNNVNNIGEVVNGIPAEVGSLIYFDGDPALRNAMQRRAVEESRLGIPILFGYDVIHGFRTVYPTSLAQACSWNPALVSEACAVAAQEARQSGVDWTFSPMIDVARDPRWGRVVEGYGEDPYVNGVFGAASVRGYQGDNIADSLKVAACLKHYVAYGASEAGRDYVYTEVSPQTLWDTYLLPYQMCVEAGAQTLMSSFNDISGTPGTANHYTLTEVLKDMWGHDGFVVSDWDAVKQLVAQGNAADMKEAALHAFNAGVEMDMMSYAYDHHLEELIAEGKVSPQRLDDAVRRVLRIKMRLGLFENPYTPEVPDRFLRPASRVTAGRLAAESMVLLKNDSTATLPLKEVSKIAVIGPLAKSKADMLGSWHCHGNPDDVTTLYEGIMNEYGNGAEVRYALGVDKDGDDTSGIAEAVEAAAWADVVILHLGEDYRWGGENASRSTIALPAIQEKLAEAVAGTGKPVVLVLSNGRPLDLSRLEPHANAILEAWQPGVNGGDAMAGILSGRINPSGKLAITFPYSTGQIPIYYNRRPTARPFDRQGLYQDITSEPLYPFGHGLSYTTFEYGTPKADRIDFVADDTIEITIPVTNTGDLTGDETVLWFINDPYSSITRPVKELKYFEKKHLSPGETAEYTFRIDPMRDLAMVDGTGRRILEPGEYRVLVADKVLTLNYKGEKLSR